MEYSEEKYLFNAVFEKCEFVGESSKFKMHFKNVYKQDNDEFICNELVVISDDKSEQNAPFNNGEYVSFKADKDFKEIQFKNENLVSKYGKYE